MCTFNGESHLAEQLDSIASQTRPPDELVVCDDASTDATTAIVRRFAERAPFPVRLLVNASNLGLAGNFSRAFAECRGEWILSADQDDIWMPNKIARLQDAIEARPDAGLIFSDATLVGADGSPLGYSLWESLRFGRREWRLVNEGRAFEVLVRRNVVTGMAMVFRADLRSLILPVPKGWIPDGWVALIISAVAPCLTVEGRLVAYRQHEGQLVGGRRLSLIEQYRRARSRGPEFYAQVAANFRAAGDRLAQAPDRLRPPGALEALAAKASHFEMKCRIRQQRKERFRLVAQELFHGHYLRYSGGWRSLAADLFA